MKEILTMSIGFTVCLLLGFAIGYGVEHPKETPKEPEMMEWIHAHRPDPTEMRFANMEYRLEVLEKLLPHYPVITATNSFKAK